MQSALVIVGESVDLFTSEAQELVNLLGSARISVKLLQASHSSLELYRMLRESPFQLVWVASHSSEEGFTLGGETIKPSEIGLFLQEAKTTDLVLNSCYSVQHVDIIQKLSNVNIVATIAPEGILDEEAWTAALYLGRAIARTGNLRQAYLQILAGKSSSYRWFPALTSRSFLMPETPIEGRLLELEKIVSELVRALQGDNFSRRKGLIQLVEESQVQMDASLRSTQEWRNETDLRLKRIEKDHSGANILIMNWRTIIYLAILFMSCSGLIILLTYLLQ